MSLAVVNVTLLDEAAASSDTKYVCRELYTVFEDLFQCPEGKSVCVTVCLILTLFQSDAVEVEIV